MPLRDTSKRENFCTIVSNQLSEPLGDGAEEGWDLFSELLMKAGVEELWYTSKKSKDWFNFYSAGIQEQLEAKCKGNTGYPRNPSSEYLQKQMEGESGHSTEGATWGGEPVVARVG